MRPSQTFTRRRSCCTTSTKRSSRLLAETEPFERDLHRSIPAGITQDELDDPHELDIDHVVSLGEAWRSGADTWDPALREAFANDLEEPDALMAVTAATNRSKSDSDPAAWQPPNHSGWCRWARAVVTVKRKWSLTVDPAEATALTNILGGCSPRL